MRKLLQDRIVIVVGVGPALGRATALACADEGAKVVLAARSEDKMAEVADEIAARSGTSVSGVTDMLDAKDSEHLVAKPVETFGLVDGLV